MTVGLFALGLGHSWGNPTGGQVAAGSASINTVPGTVTINQASNIAIINWNTFSINAGELTKFIQPSSSSAVLNRVLGGETSSIKGTLSANGQVYLVNGNGILIGPGGLICADGFTASTRDIADSDFLSGNLHFVGSSSGRVANKGTIDALGGDVYLIGQTVYNRGLIRAPDGTVGLAAGDDVLLAQQNSDGSTMTVNPSSLATGASDVAGVTNRGKITAASVELKAANGNLYALAINNAGIIRATTVSHQGGHIYLSADSGTVQNIGLLDASADATDGQGGSVSIAAGGTTIDAGVIRALGGQGGRGGNVGISSPVVRNIGVVNTTAHDGVTGNLLVTPSTFTVAPTGGDETGAQVAANLATTNTTINANNSVIIDDSITWTADTTLTLSTNVSGSTILINSPISGVAGGLIIDTAGAADIITPNSTVNVASFVLQNGSWTQNSGTLPAFVATNDFEIQGGSFLRAAGGSGTTASPYIITDVYGLQGIASLPLNNSYALGNNIDASGTTTWNPVDETPTGFVPIGEDSPFTGTFNGGGFTVNGLFIDLPNATSAGLFGTVSGATISNVGVTNANVTGGEYVGSLVGYTTADSVVDSSYSSGTVAGDGVDGGQYSWVGGLVGYNDDGALINNSQSSASATSIWVAAGLLGENFSAVQFCSSTGSANGTDFAGGLVGGNFGTISNSYSHASAYSSSGDAGGLSATIEAGSLVDCYSTGQVSGYSAGGLVGGDINGIATDCFWDEQTSGITSQNGAGTPENTAFFKNPSNFPASWNFSTVWQAPTGSGSFPTLRANPYISPVTPPAPTPDSQSDLAALDNFGAYTANGSPPLVDLSFYPFDIGNDLVSVDNPDGDGGAINDGNASGKKGTDIASGSSTSNAPALSRLLTNESGINSIFRGTVNPAQPSDLVLKKFDLILSNQTETELQGAVFGSH